MAGKPEERLMRPSSDTARSYLGDPKCTESMRLGDTGGSVRVTIPDVAAKFLGYEPGETREVEVYSDGVFIPREAPDE
jgi:hypothetical protein